jgi:L-lactate dehydrogenase
MKVGIVGSGLVGATSAFAIMMRKSASKIVLIDSNMKRASAEAYDIAHAVPFGNSVSIEAGSYNDLSDAKVVVVAAGANQKPGETRMMLMERNASIMRDIISNVVKFNPNPIFLIATNPVDVITHICARIASEYGIATTRVIGSGTTLDTARFRHLLGSYTNIDPRNIHAYVVGEHGDSEVLNWSNVDISGVPIEEFCRARGILFDESVRTSVHKGVRDAAYHIIEGKGSTYYGIGAAIAKIIDIINSGSRSILTVCTHNEDVEGVKDVTLSLPHIIGEDGDAGVLPIKLSDQERELLRRSAEVIKAKILEYKHEPICPGLMSNYKSSQNR